MFTSKTIPMCYFCEPSKKHKKWSRGPDGYEAYGNVIFIPPSREEHRMLTEAVRLHLNELQHIYSPYSELQHITIQSMSWSSFYLPYFINKSPSDVGSMEFSDNSATAQRRYAMPRTCHRCKPRRHPWNGWNHTWACSVTLRQQLLEDLEAVKLRLPEIFGLNTFGKKKHACNDFNIFQLSIDCLKGCCVFFLRFCRHLTSWLAHKIFKD